MAKSKEPKTASKAKSEIEPLSTVKNASVIKPSQTPVAKSKQIAKETAAKVNGKSAKSKPVPVKEASPESSDSSASSDDDSESESESEASDSEVEAPKAAATNGKTNGHVNGNGVAKKAEVNISSDEDSSSDSDSSENDDSSDEESSDDEAQEANISAQKTASDEDSDSADSSSEEESDDEPAPATLVKKTVDAGKAVVNGAAKVVAKVTEASDDSDSSESSESSDDEGDDAVSDGSSSGSDSSDEEEKEKPTNKRKAEDDAEAPAKKSKVEAPTAEDGPKNLFVGNLSWNIDDEWLYREFEEFGELTGARVVTDRATGRSKGFGYVEFSNAANAAAALKAKKGTQIDGREANVDFSTPRDNTAPRERAMNRAAAFGDSKNPPSDTLFLGNLSFGADENTVGEAFGAHGTVINVRLPTDQETGNPKGFGYVTFDSIDGATAAYNAMTGAEIAGRVVRLDYATPRPERGDGGRGGRGGFNDRGRGGRGGGRGGSRGGFGDRGGRGGARGGRGASTNRGGFGDFQGKKQTFA